MPVVNIVYNQVEIYHGYCVNYINYVLEIQPNHIVQNNLNICLLLNE